MHDHLVEGHAEQSVYLLVAPGEGAPSVQVLPDTPQSRWVQQALVRGWALKP